MYTQSRNGSPLVRFKVYLLRRRGRRLPWRVVQNGPSYVGDLRTHSVDIGGERYTAASLHPDRQPDGAAVRPRALRAGADRLQRARLQAARVRAGGTGR